MRALLVLPILLAALLGACGGDDGGGTAEGTGFTVEVPDGWADASDRAEALEFAGFRPDLVLVGPPRDGFTPSVNVVVEAGVPPETRLDGYVEAGRAVLRAGRLGEEEIPGGEVELGEVRAAGVGGERAATFDHVRTVDGRRLRARQVVALRGSTAYTLTFTDLAERFDSSVSKLNSVLASWRWR